MSQYKPVSDLKVKVREYEKDGKTKGVWQTVGALWSTPHGSSQFITLDAIPLTSFKDGEKIPFDGRISIFNREENQEFSEKEYADQDKFNRKQTDTVIDDIEDKPISLEDIPF